MGPACLSLKNYNFLLFGFSQKASKHFCKSFSSTPIILSVLLTKSEQQQVRPVMGGASAAQYQPSYANPEIKNLKKLLFSLSKSNPTTKDFLPKQSKLPNLPKPSKPLTSLIHHFNNLHFSIWFNYFQLISSMRKVIVPLDLFSVAALIACYLFGNNQLS